MEQALAQEDPKFVSTLRGSSLERVARMRTIAAAVVFVVGIFLLMGGAMAQQTWLGIVGFVVMLASATVGLASWRGRHAPVQPQRTTAGFDFDDHPQRFDVIEGGKANRQRRHRPGRSPRSPRGSAPRAPKQGTFMQRMEQRWERRRNEGY
jgi:hypothetical protein